MFSKLVRQTHMYLALFLVPWMLMYALSTIGMNHREFLQELYGGKLVTWEKEREQICRSTFSADASPELIAGQVMRELKLEGNYTASVPKNGKDIIIVRTDAITPRRITYTPADGKLLVEKQHFRTQPFLESFHRRHGYQSSFKIDDAWSGSVDLAVFGMIFWVASGLWMWWEMKVTRLLGAGFALVGVGLFTLFALTV